MELDTNIMQTKTIANIVEVLIDVEKELIESSNRAKVAEIINRHEIAVSVINSYQQ